MFRWLNGPSNDLYRKGNKKAHIRLIFWLSVLFNALFFAAAIAHNPPAWYTNDDFRMMTIVSGAYTGTPSPDIVFMRYPVGLLLSSLYTLTASVPWYGIFTMLCMYIPSCIFCYCIIKKAYEKNYTLFGVFLYFMLFMLFIQKYVCLPQFTLTSAFMGVGTLALLYEMPEKENIKHIVLAALCAVVSFSVRSKAFYLLLPAILLVIFVRIFRDGRNYRKYLIWGASAFVLCLAVLCVDTAAWSRPEYSEFKAFKEVRAEVYDYESIPGYYDNMPFYVSNGISEVTYRAISGRFLDMDETVNTENLTKISDYINQIRTEADGIVQRIFTAFQNGLSRWYLSSDETIKYCAIFVTVLLFVCIALSIKKRKPEIIFPALVAGMLLEITYLEFNGRVMARLVDLMLLVMAVTGCLTMTEIINKRAVSLKELAGRMKSDKARGVSFVIAACAVFVFIAAGICNMQNDLDNKSVSLRETTNSKLEALMKYTENYPEAFFFYDTYNFISCTGFVFTTYDGILNNESAGSWNSHAPSYYERNQKFGFTTAVEGLTGRNAEVYFITTTAPKMGITKTLKDMYNKKLVEVDKIQSAKDVLYVYMVTDDE